MKNIAQFISWAFNPLIMPTYTLAVLFYTPTYSKTALDLRDNLFAMNGKIKLVFIALFFFILFLAPLGSLLMMKRHDQIESIELNKRKERLWPILITGFYSLILLAILLKQLNVNYFPFIFHAIAFLGVISSLVAYFLTRLFKLSLHALGVGMSAGVMMYAYIHFVIPQLWILLVVILHGGMVMSARYFLQKHNMAQLISGYLIGIILTLIVFVGSYAIFR